VELGYDGRKEAPLRKTISTVTLVLVLFVLSSVEARSAHAFIGAIGYVGYGHTFQDGDDTNFGPTIEIGGSISLPIVAVDVTYWNDLDNGSNASQIRVGGRIKPPIIPLYGRLAIGLPFDGDTRDKYGVDIIFGAGYTVFSLPLIDVNIELDYHRWTAGPSINPFELKAGVALGF